MKNVSLHFMALPVIAILLVSCGDGKASAAPSLSIIPEDCSVTVSEQISLTLSGGLDPNSRATWEANLGSVIYNAQGLTATYIARRLQARRLFVPKYCLVKALQPFLKCSARSLTPAQRPPHPPQQV